MGGSQAFETKRRGQVLLCGSNSKYTLAINTAVPLTGVEALWEGPRGPWKVSRSISRPVHAPPLPMSLESHGAIYYVSRALPFKQSVGLSRSDRLRPGSLLLPGRCPPPALFPQLPASPRALSPVGCLTLPLPWLPSGTPCGPVTWEATG